MSLVRFAVLGVCVLGAGVAVGQETDAGKEAMRLEAKVYRARAALLEAKAAESPNEAKIERLSEKLDSLRTELDAVGKPREEAAPQRGQGRGYRGGRGGGGWGGGGGHGGGGWGAGHGGGHGRRMGQNPQFQHDRSVFHFLLDNRDAIERKVTRLDDGIDTLTESDDPKVAAAIQDHVQAMYRRVEENDPIHLRDPLFAALFAEADKISMKVTPTKKGVRVVETSKDRRVARLIQAHADVVSRFLKHGYDEVHREHPVP